jgi:acyl-homoserine lactone acylase PvdQ
VNFADKDGKISLYAGGSNPGSPHLYGKTPYLAAGFSISHGDNQDLFREKIEGNKYFFDGKWRNLKIRNETILVKTGSGLKKYSY